MAKKIKRCKATSGLLGWRCTKPRDHVEKDIDVVHQVGMFIWRDGRTEKLNTGGILLKNPKVTVGGVDFTNSVRDVRVQGMGIHPTYVAKDEAHVFSDRQLNDLADMTFKGRASVPNREADLKADDEGWEAAEAVFHSMCDVPCGPNCAPSDPVTASPEHQISEWWIQQAEDEVARTVPKAIEYSATDLTDIGHDLARTAGREVSDEEAAELGVFFYLRGKMARWVGAVIAGQRVSDDTLFDIGVYVRMAQRIREFGSWPGIDTDAQDILDSIPQGLSEPIGPPTSGTLKCSSPNCEECR